MSVTESKAKTERKSSRKPAKTQETVLSALLAQTEEVSVPLASLIKSPLNVRTVPYSVESVSELAESIKGVGLLQNLVVHTLPGDRYGVAAGGRRLAALNMLAERNILPADWPVRVKVILHRIQRKVFTRNEGKQGPSLPYIPSGSFAKAMLIEGADANASVTGNESTVPMQLRITGLVEMPNSKTYDATGCFVGLEAWGDVSSERAIVRTRNISCLKNGKTIDMPIKGHVSFRGKNGIKGEVVMRNGKILGWAWGAGFVDGIGQGMERASQPAVGLGATAAYGAGDVLKMGIGGGASKAAQTLSDYYIKRAEQYHPVIPIGAGNEVTVVFQDGFQLKTVEEMALEQSQSTAEEGNPESPVPNPPSAESHLNGFNTDQMLKQLGNLNPQQFMSGDKNPQGGDAGKEGGNGG